jgi:hypothetical protein
MRVSIVGACRDLLFSVTTSERLDRWLRDGCARKSTGLGNAAQCRDIAASRRFNYWDTAMSRRSDPSAGRSSCRPRACDRPTADRGTSHQNWSKPTFAGAYVQPTTGRDLCERRQFFNPGLFAVICTAVRSGLPSPGSPLRWSTFGCLQRFSQPSKFLSRQPSFLR